MKTLYIASDIHGGFASIDRLWQIIEQDKGKKRVILLGDTYNHGPRNPFPEEYAPMKVAELLEEKMGEFDIIKGNCDSEVDQMISPFKIRGDFSIRDGERRIFFTHGHKVNPDLPSKKAVKGDVVFYGHFHVPCHKVVDGVHYVCVGSTAMPKDGSKPSYAIYKDSTIVIKALDGTEILSISL